MRTKAYPVIYVVLLVSLVVVGFSCTKQKKLFQKSAVQKQEDMFPVWQGESFIDPPSGSKIVCLVQCEPVPFEQDVKISEGVGVFGPDSPNRKYLIKTYGDKEQIRRITEYLLAPEVPGRRKIESGRCLLAVSVSHNLIPQPLIQIPFELSDDGYAITPRGKDRLLYEILKGGLDEWNAENETRKELERSQGLFWAYLRAVDERLRKELSEKEYIEKKKEPPTLSKEEFKNFLRQNNEDADAILLQLQTYYRNTDFLENWGRKCEIRPSRIEAGTQDLIRGYDDPNNAPRGEWF
jgi:hypothetical protein